MQRALAFGTKITNNTTRTTNPITTATKSKLTNKKNTNGAYI
jgi:hypothetical protein